MTNPHEDKGTVLLSCHFLKFVQKPLHFQLLNASFHLARGESDIPLFLSLPGDAFDVQKLKAVFLLRVGVFLLVHRL